MYNSWELWTKGYRRKKIFIFRLYRSTKKKKVTKGRHVCLKNISYKLAFFTTLEETQGSFIPLDSMVIRVEELTGRNLSYGLKLKFRGPKLKSCGLKVYFSKSLTKYKRVKS